MPRYQIRWDSNWSPNKVKIAFNTLRRELMLMGGVRTISQIVMVDKEKEKPPPPRLHLTCSFNPFGSGRCGHTSFAEVSRR